VLGIVFAAISTALNRGLHAMMKTERFRRPLLSISLLLAFFAFSVTAIAGEEKKAPQQPDASVSTLDDDPDPMASDEMDAEEEEDADDDLSEEELNEIERGYSDEKKGKGT
jgi:hypothetical protein